MCAGNTQIRNFVPENCEKRNNSLSTVVKTDIIHKLGQGALNWVILLHSQCPDNESLFYFMSKLRKPS